MRIAINAEPFLEKQPTGIQVYSRGLVDSIAECGSDNEYFLFYYKREKEDYDSAFYCPKNRYFKKIVQYCPYFSKGMWLNLYIPRLLRKYNIDIFHSLNYYLPSISLCRAKMIVTIHDLSFFHSDDFYETSYAKYLKKKTVSAVKKADAVIAVSNTVKKDISSFINAGDRKIYVVYNGVGESPEEETDAASVRSRYGIFGRYILSVGMVGHKKNHPNIIRAFEKVINKLNEKIQLVIAGSDGYGAGDVYNLILRMGMAGFVRLAGYADKGDLRTLLSNAEMLLFPSKAEGFGIPVLEAFQRGVPVVTSKTTATAEIAQNAALLVDPDNIEEISEAVIDILQNKGLRETLAGRGYERVKMFSWKKAADETVKIYSFLEN